MTPSPSTTHFPTFRWLFSWRFLRAMLFIFVCLGTVVALFYAEENVRGKHAWSSYVREQRAKGEKFSLAEFIPPPVPDEQNLTLCPLLKPIFDFQFRTITDGKATRQVPANKPWNDTNRMIRLFLLSRTKSVSDYHAQRPRHDTQRDNQAALASRLLERLEKPLLTNGWIDLAAWQAYYHTGTNLDGILVSVSPATDVLRSLRHLEPDLAELEQEAARRPLARWSVFYETNAPWSILLPHLGMGKRLVSLLQLRSAARLAAGETQGGLSDLELGFRLAETFQEEPFVISQLVRNACHRLLLQPLKEGLARRQFTEAQIAGLEEKLGTVDVLAAFQYSMRAERAERGWNGHGDRFPDFDWTQMFGQEKGSAYNRVWAWARLAPSGWIYQNQLALSRLYDQFALPAVDAKARRVYPEIAAGTSKVKRQTSRPFSFFLEMFSPDIDSLAWRFARSQTQLDQAVIACALERYRLAHGSFPQTLDALAPQFVGQVPHDLVSGRPIHYSLTEDGQYMLSSVGWAPTSDPNPADRFDAPVPDASDWVWRLPVKP